MDLAGGIVWNTFPWDRHRIWPSSVAAQISMYTTSCGKLQKWVTWYILFAFVNDTWFHCCVWKIVFIAIFLCQSLKFGNNCAHSIYELTFRNKPIETAGIFRKSESVFRIFNKKLCKSKSWTKAVVISFVSIICSE